MLLKSTFFMVIFVSLWFGQIEGTAQKTTTKSYKGQPTPTPARPIIPDNSGQTQQGTLGRVDGWIPVLHGSNLEFITDNYDPYLYARSGDILYRSGDFGKNWSSFVEPRRLQSTVQQCDSSGFIFKQSRSRPDVMYLATKCEIWRTQNGGVRWENMTSGRLGKSIASLSISPRNPDVVFFTVSHSGQSYYSALHKSANGGRTSAIVTPDGTQDYLFLNVSINPFDADNIVLIDATSSPIETMDGGITWRKMEYKLKLEGERTGPDAIQYRYWATIWYHPTNPSVRVGRLTTGSEAWHLILSKDNGRTWTDISPKITGYYWFGDARQEISSLDWISCVSFSKVDENIIYIANKWGAFVSAKDGVDWRHILSDETTSIVESNDGKSVYFSSYFGLFATDHRFNEALVLAKGLPPSSDLFLDDNKFADRFYLSDSFDTELIFVKSKSGDVMRSADAKGWRFERNIAENINSPQSESYGPLRIIQSFRTSDLLTYFVAQRGGSVGNRLFRLDLNGKREEVPIPKELLYTEFGCNCKLALSPSDSKKLYLYSDTKSFVSDDSGASWRESIRTGIELVQVSSRDSNHAYAIVKAKTGSLNQVITTIDGGITWSAGPTPLGDLAMNLEVTAPFETLKINPKNPAEVYVTSKGGLFGSTDSGKSWRLTANKARFGGEILGFEINPVANGEYFVVTSTGVWRSVDSGRTWTLANLGVYPDDRIYRIIAKKNFLVAIGKRRFYRYGELERFPIMN